MAEQKESLGNIMNEMKNIIREETGLFGGDNFILKLDQAYQDLNVRATEVNKNLLQNRERIGEIKMALADAVPKVAVMGGQMSDVVNTISEAAEASRRNVILSTDSVGKMFAASQILGKSVGTIVDDFLDIGIQLNNISGDIEKSINYVQSIGGDAKAVMADVLYNTDQLNRFNFENGVQGLTRMAAKASMLRLDMSDVFRFAENLVSPEMAIDAASSFQRLGVATGALVDPFALMFKSIADPEGLQDSIIDLTKRFVSFNDETGNFKINPAGVLQMRELSNVLGMQYKDFARVAVAAADMDKRISEISFEYSGEKEDLMMLANMAQFKGGEYVVNFKGQERLLRSITKDEFDIMKDAQEKAPKTLEDIARGQMSVTENIRADVRAITNKILYGIVSEPSAQNLAEEIRRGQRLGGQFLVEATPETTEFRKGATSLLDIVKEIGSSIKDGLTDAEVDKIAQMGNQLSGEVGKAFSESSSNAMRNLVNRLDQTDKQEKKVFDIIMSNKDILTNLGITNIDKTETIQKKITEQIINNNINVDGTINHNIQVPIGLNKDEAQRLINKTLDDPMFKERIIKIYESIPVESTTGGR